MVEVEICISADSPAEAEINARAAFEGGADRIELCAGMSLGGLTPPGAGISAAREAFPKKGLMVMVRPRDGDFCYSEEESGLMARQAEEAADAGADGVVCGVLSAGEMKVDEERLKALISLARGRGLSVTFHRAVDAASDPLEALSRCIDLGVDRVLTAGKAWKEADETVRDLALLEKMAALAAGRIEVVIGGGVDHANAAGLMSRFISSGCALSVHSWSGVLENGTTSADKVKRLVEAVKEGRI